MTAADDTRAARVQALHDARARVDAAHGFGATDAELLRGAARDVRRQRPRDIGNDALAEALDRAAVTAEAGATVPTDETRATILSLIVHERVKQDAKWGEQNHPDVDPILTTRKGGCTPARMAEEYGIPAAWRARSACDGAAASGQCTWAHIFVEELAELIEVATLAQQGQPLEAEVDKELVQVLAVGVAWLEARSRRALRALDAMVVRDDTAKGG